MEIFKRATNPIDLMTWGRIEKSTRKIKKKVWMFSWNADEKYIPLENMPLVGMFVDRNNKFDGIVYQVGLNQITEEKRGFPCAELDDLFKTSNQIFSFMKDSLPMSEQFIHPCELFGIVIGRPTPTSKVYTDADGRLIVSELMVDKILDLHVWLAEKPRPWLMEICSEIYENVDL